MAISIVREVKVRHALFQYLVNHLQVTPLPDYDHYRRTLLQYPTTTLLRWLFSVTDIPETGMTEFLAREHRLVILPDSKLLIFPEAVDYYQRFVPLADMDECDWIPVFTNGPFLYLAHYDPFEPLPKELPCLVGKILLSSSAYEALRIQWGPIRRALAPKPALSEDVRTALANPPRGQSADMIASWLGTCGLPSSKVDVGIMSDFFGRGLIRFPLRKLGLEYVDLGVSRKSLVDWKAYPFYRFGSVAFIAVENPEDPKLLSAIEMKFQDCSVVCVPVDGETLRERWAHLQASEIQAEERRRYISIGDIGPLRYATSEVDATEVIRVTERILVRGYELHASDIHLQPCRDNAGFKVRYRLDGALHDADEFTAYMGRAVMTRLKVMSGLNIGDNRLPQDGRLRLKVEDKAVDIRVAVSPLGEESERAVLRILDAGEAPTTLDSLNFPPDDLLRMKQGLLGSSGLILVSGPTGSGKTTTLYAALRRLATPDISVATVEDPVEIRLEGVQQHEVRNEGGFTFAVALRSILRLDPDCILVGEIRDQETAATAVRAANTGHLVLSTVHATDALACLTRVIDMGAPRFLVGEVARLLVAQRLVRRLCRSCRLARPITAAEQTVLFAHGYSQEQLPDGVFAAKGCPHCYYTGYQRRFGVVETLVVESELRRAFVEGRSGSDLMQIAKSAGFRPMYVSALGRALLGDTSFEEIEFLNEDTY